MKVKLLNDGGYGEAENVKFPVEVEGSPYYNNVGDLCGVDVKESVLIDKGFKLCDYNDTLFFSFNKGEAVQVTPTEQTDTTFMRDITNKCCNQFGERDEIQAIIDKLRADVAQRDERIKVLDSKCSELYKLAEELGACSEFLKVNFACSWG